MEKKIKTIREAVSTINRECGHLLANKDADTLRILEYVVELNEIGIFSNLDSPLSDKQLSKIEKVIERLKKDEPLEYIIGTGYFYGKRFKVTKDTLIPRPETELLVDLAISEIMEMVYADNGGDKELEIVDVGTGTACIPISISYSVKVPIGISATDISTKALTIAKQNIRDAKLERNIQTYLSDLFQAIPRNKKFNLIVANLPYISTSKIENLPKSVKSYEPRKALDGGKDGMSVVKKFLTQARDRLTDKGTIIIELDPSQTEEIEKFSRKIFKNSKIIKTKDLTGKERFLTIRV